MTTYLTLQVTILHETPKAYLVADPDDEEDSKGWLPKSQVRITDEDHYDGPGSIVDIEVPEWLVDDKELNELII